MEKTFYCFGWKTPEGKKGVSAFRTSREAATAYERAENVPVGATVYLFDAKAPRHLNEAEAKKIIEQDIDLHLSNSVIWYVKSHWQVFDRLAA